jgi:hypothetical protein
MISKLLFSSKIIMFLVIPCCIYAVRPSGFFCLGRNQIRLHDNNHMIKRYQNTSFIVFICTLSGTPKYPATPYELPPHACYVNRPQRILRVYMHTFP